MILWFVTSYDACSCQGMDVSQVERWLGRVGRVANGNKKHHRTLGE